MRRNANFIILLLFIFGIKNSNADIPFYKVKAELLVTNIHGLSGIRQVGPFHAGGAIPSNPEFLIETLPGHILDPERLLVASASNYGLKRHNNNMLQGSSLSLDVSGVPFAIPDQFATINTKALEGRIILYSAQSTRYINAYYNSTATTRDLPNIANPKYISVNNAFGRPWHANAPYGIKGPGLVSVSDPDGRPLANPPSIENGGVFFGKVSNRIYGSYRTITDIRALLPGNVARKKSTQYIKGDLTSASLGTVFMGISPDSSNFAVFASVGANGSLSQIHVQDGVDGLMHRAIIHPHHDETTSAGMVFRWIPSFALFVADYYGDRIALVHLKTDENIYRMESVTYITSPYLQKPVDIAAAIPEIANPRFSSNTTMAGNSDLYIANKNGEIIRIDEHGNVLAIVKLLTDFEHSLNGEIRSISTSYDAQTIYVGMEGRQNRDFIVKIPAFDASGIYSKHVSELPLLVKFRGKSMPVVTQTASLSGEELFSKKFSPDDGIRQIFNATSCLTCHDDPVAGGYSANENNFVRRVSMYNKISGQFEPIKSHNFPVARRYDARHFGKPVVVKSGLPTKTNIVSLRMPPSLLHIGRLDEIPDIVLLSHARSKGDGIQGRVNYIQTPDGPKIGRYGWKASHTSLTHIVADAFDIEIGLDSSYATNSQPEQQTQDNDSIVEQVVQYLERIDENSGR